MKPKLTPLQKLREKQAKQRNKKAKLEARKVASKEKKKLSVSKLSEKADNLWKLVVKKGGKCEVCGKTQYLNAHHIFSRHNKSTRWDIDNGICLCAGCHVFSDQFSAHKTPSEFTYWLEKQYSREYIEILGQKARKPLKVTPEFLLVKIEELESKL